MKFLGTLVAAASGSIRGLVASHNKGGQYFRGRTTPTNPKSAKQVQVRNFLTSLIARFRTTATGSNRAGWDTFAKNTLKTDTLGSSIEISGQNWYIAANSIRLQAGLAPVDVGPTTFALSTLGTFTGTATAAATNVAIAWSAGGDWNAPSAGAGVLLYASRPQNSTVNYFNGPYQFAGLIQSSATAGSANVALPFPTGPAGSKLFLRLVATAADGRPSSEFRLGPTAI